MMSEFYWPQDIIPSSQTWRVIDASGAFTSPLTGATRTVSRPGTRVGCSITVSNLTGSQRHRLMGVLSALNGRSHRIWIPDFSTSIRGSFPTGEALSNSSFPNTSGWSSSAAELSLYADSGRLRLSRSGTVADRYAYSQVSTTSGAKYLFRAGLLAGYGSMNYALQLGTTAGGAELSNTPAYTANGYRYTVATASGASAYASVRDYASGRSADNFQIVDTPSVSRCATVNGASQTGSGLWVSGLPASTTGLLVAGDMVAVYTSTWEIKRVTADLNSNGSGNGYLVFEPALRSSPAAGAPIAIWRPTAKFMLAGNELSWETVPGRFTGFTVDFMEDVT
jgi:hypothetical protein